MTDTQEYKTKIENAILRIERLTQKIQNRYDPEMDLNPLGLGVNWAENDLAEAVKELTLVVKMQGERIDQLEKGTLTHRAIAAKGGKARTDRKVAASRMNGRKGGRPRKAE